MIVRSPLTIYLSDLANTYYGISPSTIPLACGYLAAYLKKLYCSHVDVRIFRDLRSLLDATKVNQPDIAGFGIYAWNPRLTVLASRLIKERYPSTITVAGGPAVELTDTQNLEYLRRNPHIDVLVRHEGEIAFANIVGRVLGADHAARCVEEPIDGAWFLRDGQLVAGRAVPLISPLEDTVPSPYLMGLFDDLLRSGELMPLIQTTRGCPYSCTFCVSGQPVYNKLRSFSVDRVKEEILYLQERAVNRSIRFTDDNFGLLERDVEIARFVRDLYDRHHYPAGLKIYYGKLISERIKECARILKPLLPLCMSFQSLTPRVLDEIKRPNNTRERFEEARRWARQHDVAVATELIFGLPRETYESWVAALDGVVELRVDSVFPNGLLLLDGAELNTPEAREQYGFRTKFCLGADGITQFDGVVSVECEEFVVETHWMSEADFYRLNQLRLFAMWFIGYGFFKEMLYHAVTSQITLSEMFEEVVTNPGTYPVFHQLLEAFDADTRASFFHSRQQLDAHIATLLARGETVEVTRLATVYVAKMISQKDAVLGELERLIVTLHQRRMSVVSLEFQDITHTLAEITKDLLVPLGSDVPEAITVQSRWDLVRWRRDDYQQPLSKCGSKTPMNFDLVMNNIVQTRMTNKIVSTLPDDHMKMQYYLRNTNSSNTRRQIVYASDRPASKTAHLLNLEGFADAAQSVRPGDFSH